MNGHSINGRAESPRGAFQRSSGHLEIPRRWRRRKPSERMTDPRGAPRPPAAEAALIPQPELMRSGDGRANRHFKQVADAVFWAALILATGIHYGVFRFWPDMTAEVISVGSGDFTAITLPPKIEIPAAPQTIARPAVPVMVSGNIDEAITIAPTTFESNPISVLPPPTTTREASTERDLAKAPIFTPFTVKPEIRNRGEVAQALARMYPPLLRDAGIGGTVLVWFFINAEGKVERTLVREGSGHADLDEAALKVADIITFTPALNRDKRVPVWISLPITFTVR